MTKKTVSVSLNVTPKEKELLERLGGPTRGFELLVTHYLSTIKAIPDLRVDPDDREAKLKKLLK